MQIIMLAAGMGRRLRHESVGKPKCMVEINGKTLVQRSLENFAEADIDRIVMVIGHHGDMLKAHLGERFNGIPVIYIENPKYASTNNIYSLSLASHHMEEDDSIILESDLIYDKPIIQKLLAHPAPNVVVVDKYKPYMDGTVIKISPGLEVVSLIPKSHFDYREIHQYYKTVNIYKFSRDFSKNSYIPFLKAYCQVLGNNRFYEQVLRVILTLDQKNLTAMVLDGDKWYEIDSLPDLANAGLVFADEPSKKYRLFLSRYGGYWYFEHVLDFCYLTNPYFLPDRLLEEFKLVLGDLICNYPSGQRTQRLLTSDLLDCLEDYLFVANGASEIIEALFRVVRGKTGVVLPTFEEYLSRVSPGDLVTLTPENDDFSYTLSDLKDFSEQVQNLVLINPANPTGHFISREEVVELAGYLAKKDKMLILDESFIDFVVDRKNQSLVNNDIVAKHPNLFIIRSISKSYNTPGLRVGVAVCGNTDLLNRLQQVLPIWNINSFAEFFLQIIPKYRGEYRNACLRLAHAREELLDQLRKIHNLRPIPSSANFILCEVMGGVSAQNVAEHLLFHDNILIRNCTGKTGIPTREFIRVAVRTSEQNRVLTEALLRTMQVLERESRPRRST